ncbi:MAG: VOC family protein [Intrasporangium sp.]|uniref:VOC family protein n=1 Tax=Intrasporangium sp. TaxID=1925024 RepID=UPI0026480008|nr:VOC family protein [Intrasporangium sp.]MDN5796654.1 VOC family protein [Intrasporangium sp.]
MTTSTATLSLSNCFVTVDDPEAALGFYRDVLGLSVHTDVTVGEFRWLTLTTPTQPSLEISMQVAGDGGLPMSEGDKEAQRDLLAKGLLSALIFDCADVDALFEHVRGAGAEVLQEPTDQFYGVRDCAFRDPAGNMVRFKTDLTR